jgi:phage antirepressor YoqD-like protein
MNESTVFEIKTTNEYDIPETEGVISISELANALDLNEATLIDALQELSDA